MGCDIHVFAERRDELGNWVHVPMPNGTFEHRNYGLFGWLADVRNYSAVPPISTPRGLPNDVGRYVKAEYDEWSVDAHTPSWLFVSELTSFDYDSTVEDRRYTKRISENFYDGGATCEPGQGKTITYREFFGDGFFRDLEALRDSGAERIVFWFDN